MCYSFDLEDAILRLCVAYWKLKRITTLDAEFMPIFLKLVIVTKSIEEMNAIFSQIYI